MFLIMVKNIWDQVRKKKDDNNNKKNFIVFWILGGILLIIILGLVIDIVIFQCRNKQLVFQVIHISFAKTIGNTVPNLLLHK